MVELCRRRRHGALTADAAASRPTRRAARSTASAPYTTLTDP